MPDVAELETPWQIQTALSTLRILDVQWKMTLANPEINLAWHSFCAQNRPDVCQECVPPYTVSYPAKETLPREVLVGMGQIWARACTVERMTATTAQACSIFLMSYKYRECFSFFCSVFQRKSKTKALKATELHLCNTWVKRMQLTFWGSILNCAWAALGTRLWVNRTLYCVLGQGSEVSVRGNGHMLSSILLLSACGLSELFDSHCTETIWKYCFSSVW